MNAQIETRTLLVCIACGKEVEAGCACGVDYVPKTVRAAEAIKANPEKSDRMIAKELGVDQKTVWNARTEQVRNDSSPEKRIGLDGKKQAAKKKRPESEPASDPIRTNLSKPEKNAAKEKAEASGTNLSSIVSDTVRAYIADEPIDPTTLSKTAQEKLAAFERQLRRRLEAEFEERARAKANDLIERLSMPRLREIQADAARVINARKGVFKQDDYNKILRCLHPDGSPTIAQKNEAFRLWYDAKLVLLSAKDDPRQYSSLPTLEELRAAAKQRAMAK